MPKNLLPWLAIAAIVNAQFLLSEFPGREAAGLRPAEAWKQGVHLLTVSDTPALEAAALLEQATSFEAPEDLAPETVEMLRSHQAAGDATDPLHQALLEAAERRLAGQD